MKITLRQWLIIALGGAVVAATLAKWVTLNSEAGVPPRVVDPGLNASAQERLEFLTYQINVGDVVRQQKIRSLYERAGIYWRLDRLEEASADCTRLIELTQSANDDTPKLEFAVLNHSQALACRASILEQRGDLEAALRDRSADIALIATAAYRKASPFFWERSLGHALRDRSDLHYKMRDRPAAIQDLDTLLALEGVDPEDRADALRSRANTHGSLGHIEQAIKDYSAILAMEGVAKDMRSGTLLMRAFSYGLVKDIPRAIADYTAVMDMPDAPPEDRAEAKEKRSKLQGE